MSALDRIEAALAAHGCNPRRRGDHLDAKCSGHDDGNPSLSVDGTSDRALIKCHAGCELDDILSALDLTKADLFDEPAKKADKPEIVATYPYVGADGEVLFYVKRFMPKDFRQCRPGPDGELIWKTRGVEKVPYRLPDLIAGVEADRWIMIVEGERDVDHLRSLGIVATTNSGGAGKFDPKFAHYFKEAKVAILPDADDVGRQHAEQVATILSPVAEVVKVIELSGLPEHGDVSDWLANGGTAAELKKMILAAPKWERSQEPTSRVPEIEPRRRPVSQVLADVEPEEVHWLWRDRIPLSKVTVFDGDPDKGKSTVTLDVGARVTTHSPMPDGSRSDLPGPAAVIVLSAEDGAGDTIRPRADAANADVDRIHLLTDVEVLDDEGRVKRLPWMLPRDLDVLRILVERTGAKLVIIDPLNAFLDGKVDSYRDQDVRGALRPLAELAESTGAAIVVIRHLSKTGGTNALYRGGGSIGIIGAVRSGLLAALDPDDETGQTRVLATHKHNLTVEPPALRYELVASEQHGCARVRWLGESSHSASALLAEPASEDERSDRNAVAEVIAECLKEGPRARTDVVKAIRGAGLDVGDKTIQRACRALGVRRQRLGFGPESSFVLAMPDTPDKDASVVDPFSEAVHCVQYETDQHFPEPSVEHSGHTGQLDNPVRIGNEAMSEYEESASEVIDEETWNRVGERIAALPPDSPPILKLTRLGWLQRNDLSREEIVDVNRMIDDWENSNVD